MYFRKLGEVSGLVYVAAAADGDVVGEELQGDDFEDGEEELGGLGDVDDVFDQLGDVWSPSMAMAMTRPERAVTSWMFERVFSYLRTLVGSVGSFGGDADDGEGLVDEGVGAVLHLAGGVAFGVDVGDLLELEGAFEGDGVVDAAAEEEEVVGGVRRLWRAGSTGREGDKRGRVRRRTPLFELAGDAFGELGDEVEGLLGERRDGAASCARPRGRGRRAR
jgi:hypothetical protein